MDPHMFALGGGNGEAGSERHKSTTQRCGVNGENGRNVKKGAAAHRVQSYAAGPFGSPFERDLDRCTYENASCLLACVLVQSWADFLESTQAYDRAEYGTASREAPVSQNVQKTLKSPIDMTDQFDKIILVREDLSCNASTCAHQFLYRHAKSSRGHGMRSAS
jgi:hypothetical protein